MADKHYLQTELFRLIHDDEAIFHFFQENVFDGLWFWDLEQKEQIYMNDSFWRMLGYKASEMPHSSSVFEKILSQEEIQQVIPSLENYIKHPDGIWKGMVQYIHKSGSLVWAKSKAIAICNSSGKAVKLLGTITDITEQKKAEQLLKQQNERYLTINEEYKQVNEQLKESQAIITEKERLFNAIFNNNPNPTHLVDRDFNIILSNKRLLELKKINLDDVIGKKCYEVYQGRSSVCNNCMVKRVFEGEPMASYENKLVLPDGEERYFKTFAYPIFDDDGNVIYATETTIDITDQRRISEQYKQQNEEYAILTKKYKIQNEHLKRSKELLQKKELQFRLLFEHSPLGIYISTPAGNILEVNDALIKILGSPSAEATKQINVLSFEALQKNGYSEAFKKCLKKKEVIYIEMPYTTKWNKTVYLSSFLVPLVNDDGKVEMVYTILKDITKRKKAEEELKIAKQKAEQSDKLKTEFIHNMSHEIRTPMNGIMGFASFLKDSDLSKDQRNEYISVIENSGRQLLRIIDDILEISRLDTKQVKMIEEEVCLNNLLMEQYSIFKMQSDTQRIPLYLKETMTCEESTIISDASKLKKIIGNLLENAFKYTQKGFIELGYNLAGTPAEPTLEIYVKDTGVGISAKNQKTIFERFSQEEKELSQKTGGLGLGLSIAKENTELLGGFISLESKKGKGALFKITIPYKPVLNSVKDVYSSYSQVDNDGFSTVLIAEDEDTNFLYLETVLKYLGMSIRILHAKNGEEAVAICQEHPEIKVVLMDLKMPVMDGYEATRHIKTIRPNLPVVAQTAYSSVEDEQKALQAGCDAFMTKPITKETLKKKFVDVYLSVSKS